MGGTLTKRGGLNRKASGIRISSAVLKKMTKRKWGIAKYLQFTSIKGEPVALVGVVYMRKNEGGITVGALGEAIY